MRHGIRLLAIGTALVAGRPVAAQENETDWGLVEFFRDLGLTRGAIAAPVDSAWPRVKAVIEHAGIPVKLENRSTGELGNVRHRAVGRLRGTVLSRYFSCGEGAVGPNADHYHVFIKLVVKLVPQAADRTRFDLQLQADAVDVPNGRPERLPCGTTGRLERRIVELLNEVFPGTT